MASAIQLGKNDMADNTSDAYDRVTLLQMQRGVKLYECVLHTPSGEATYIYSYKSTETHATGDLVVVQVKNGCFGIARVCNLAKTLVKGHKIKWIVGKVDKALAESFIGVDEEMEMKLELGRAQNEAKMFLEAIGMSEADVMIPQLEAPKDSTMKPHQPDTEDYNFPPNVAPKKYMSPQDALLKTPLGYREGDLPKPLGDDEIPF